MDLQPAFVAPPEIRRIDPRLQPLFDRTLRESGDPEFLEIAALSLARIAREKHGDIASSVDVLTQTMTSSQDLRIRQACALALIQSESISSAPQLLDFTAKADDSIRLVIEPSLARWKFKPAAEVWMGRLSNRLESSSGIRLACEGLITLESVEAAEVLQRELDDRSNPFPRRMASAAALARLGPQRALTSASALSTGPVSDRLLAVAASANQQAESTQLLSRLCIDESQAVASAAWLTLFDQNADALKPLLETGRKHSDAVVRMTSARVMNRFPTPEYCTWLNELLSDAHIEVRNVARQMLVLNAAADETLRLQIIDQAATKISGNPADWQGIEQALLVLGQVRSARHSLACLPLLTNGRAEVEVTAAWLMHLYPDPNAECRLAVLKQIEDREALLKTVDDDPDMVLNAGFQLAHLFQLCGLLRERSQLQLLSENYSKTCRGGEVKRAAAMWAIGLSHENEPLPEIVGQLESRVRDRTGPNPEREVVRRMSVMALGWMNSSSSEETLKDSWKMDPPVALIPQSARWVMLRLGLEELPEPKGDTVGVGGWKLLPAEPLPAELLLSP
ncbi:MAG: hypothetical protein JNL58_05420 [Planctomyces sp.]|nr:hypothetical protein [Planctomyces sp.]